MRVVMPAEDDLAKKKAAARKDFTRKRERIPDDLRIKKSRQAAFILQDNVIFKNAFRIAAYFGFKFEISLTPIIEMIWSAKKECYLPSLNRNKTLSFIKYDQHDELFQNPFGILEPVASNHKIPVEELDLILMPLLAFDQQGNRLGMGGGYYDRTLESIKSQHNRPVLMGVAFQEQEASHLPKETWDVQLDYVLTDQKFWRCKG